MPTPIKPLADKEATFDLLDIRVGKIIKAEPEQNSPKPIYKLTVDFGKYGQRVSAGRFTQHSVEELVGQPVLGVLNFPKRNVGTVESEVLILGVQFPKADSGEATFITPANKDAKLGGKLF